MKSMVSLLKGKAAGPVAIIVHLGGIQGKFFNGSVSLQPWWQPAATADLLQLQDHYVQDRVNTMSIQGI
jgi:hypothetical protein